MLTEALKFNNSLTELELMGNNIDHKSFTEISKVLG